jgi:hypothetical protein
MERQVSRMTPRSQTPADQVNLLMISNASHKEAAEDVLFSSSERYRLSVVPFKRERGCAHLLFAQILHCRREHLHHLLRLDNGRLNRQLTFELIDL